MSDLIERLQADIRDLIDVLQRHGFVRCDSPACNCGSWHPRHGLPERMAEIKDALAEAGHPLCNENGNLALNALRELTAEVERLRADAGRLWKALNDLSFACDGVVATRAPSREVYNNTFDVMDKLRYKYAVHVGAIKDVGNGS